MRNYLMLKQKTNSPEHESNGRVDHWLSSGRTVLKAGADRISPAFEQGCPIKGTVFPLLSGTTLLVQDRTAWGQVPYDDSDHTHKMVPSC